MELSYEAKSVVMVGKPGAVYAFWTADAELAKAIPSMDVGDVIMHRDVELVADAHRYYKSRGAGLSGWVVESVGYNSEPVPNQYAAMVQLGLVIIDYFQGREA